MRLFLSDNCPSILGPIQQDLIRSNDPRKNVSGNNYHNSMYDIPQRFHAKRARTESELNMCPEYVPYPITVGVMMGEYVQLYYVRVVYIRTLFL